DCCQSGQVRPVGSLQQMLRRFSSVWYRAATASWYPYRYPPETAPQNVLAYWDRVLAHVRRTPQRLRERLLPGKISSCFVSFHRVIVGIAELCSIRNRADDVMLISEAVS